MFPFPPGAQYPDWKECTTPASSAARTLAVSYSLHDGGKTVDDVRLKLCHGLKGLGEELERHGLAKEAVQALQVACLVLSEEPDSPHNAETFVREREKCAARLRDLGVSLLKELPVPPALPVWSLEEILASGAGGPASPVVAAPTATDVASAFLVPDGSHDGEEAEEESERPEADEREEAQGHERTGIGSLQTSATTARELVAELAVRWSSGRSPVGDRTTKLRTYFREVSGEHGALADRELALHLDRDLAAVAGCFPQGLVPTDAKDLWDLARAMRTFATWADKAEQVEEARLRWLISATANHMMWSDDGLPTNRPHVLRDLIGYLRSFLDSNLKFMDSARDLILDCAEILVCVAHEVPPVFMDRYAILRHHALAAVGTHLLLAGPNPALPQESTRDSRVLRRGRVSRSEWPELLLREWRAEDRHGACFALACVAGWDEARTHWVVDTVFDRAPELEEPGERELWKEGVSSLMEAAGKVRVVSNPWESDGKGNPRGTSLVTSAAGAVRIPTPVLRAAVAQGLEPGEVVTVRGQLFKGRRMPTYLLTTRYGPRSVLKIDRWDKVQREGDNFRTYAKRLHPNNRPSECLASTMEMYLGDNGDSLRAIETAYAFEQGEPPRTLTDWLGTAPADRAVETFERLLLVNMRPWFAHSRRDRIDIRSEYPVFRPAPAPKKQAPANWARTELHALLKAAADAGRGMPTTVKADDTAWSADAPGLAAAMARLPQVATVNPLWFAAELSETGQGAFEDIINSFDIDLVDYDTTLVIAHGDLHLDNVLCTLSSKRPKPVLIDFESAHEGHVCKDFARIEASLLCQVFSWDGEAAGRVASWIAGVLAGTDDPLRKPGDLLPRVNDPDEVARLTDQERLVLRVTRRVREIAIGCGQGHWPVKADEYHLALAGALLPMIRYSTLEKEQREFALTLSTVITSALWHRWNAIVQGGN
ncbi:phosphotransferase [Streptomyces sp. NPDC127092]|uniref:phosphotransferase n=1 Tax=Streptomyces sp. NPDC127092 TaxID=3347135 RepID=UPI003646B48C